jgi:hypothetical protein
MIMSKQWESIERTVAQAAEEELLRLRGLIDEALAALQTEEAAEEVTDNEQAVKSRGAKAGGYIELKTINGCGPYAYRRARVGGRLTSEYIGKVKQ